MKKYLTTLLAACCMLAAFSMPASALEYHFDGPDAGVFGRPTSDDTIYVTMDKPVNTDRSKNAAMRYDQNAFILLLFIFETVQKIIYSFVKILDILCFFIVNIRIVVPKLSGIEFFPALSLKFSHITL